MQRQWKPTKRWWKAYGALHGETQATTEAVKPKKKRQNVEEVEQIKFNIWFDKFLWARDYRWFHCPNGGGRSLAEGAKFKRMGVKAGIPDIILPMARSSYHGLVIELKRPDGKPNDVRPEQQDWLDWFKKQGWCVHVAYGFEDAKRILREYFN